MGLVRAGAIIIVLAMGGGVIAGFTDSVKTGVLVGVGGAAVGLVVAIIGIVRVARH